MKETEGLINQGMNSTSDKEFANISQGTNDSRGLLTQPDNFSSGLASDPMSEAIRGKYSRNYNIHQSGLQNKMKVDARNSHFEKVRVAHELANEEAQINFQKEMTKYKQKMAKRQQRQALIGQTLGLVGGVVGGIYGGPAGAAGGSTAGQAAGSVDYSKV